jgi:hypothetical protein
VFEPPLLRVVPAIYINKAEFKNTASDRVSVRCCWREHPEGLEGSCPYGPLLK